jgi:hypothetical protein
MTKPVFITIIPDLVGKPWIQVFGKYLFVGEIPGDPRMGGLLPEDVGRRIYLTEQTDLVIEPEETRQKRDMYPMIAELRDSLSVAVLHDEDDDTYALGEPRLGGAMTPWFESEAELEEYCRQNIDALRGQSKPN